ncbi:MAG TPA: isoprenylcysteine carboxylmethyltransferase family protein [Steroidobacteraceae bacterium]|nr:isoprenylcysteine carboxylmethyltransferase family protein [Steroidobacteraceae bacterium]
MIAIGNFLFRCRNALFPLAFGLVFLPGPPLFEDPLMALAAGALLALMGEAMRVGTIGLKYIIRGGRERRVYAEDLVTGGLYSHTRNPMYVGNLLILAGIAVASNSWTCVIVAIPLFAFFYACIVAAEEDYLGRKFGPAFDAYVRDVPRWAVRIQGLSATLRSTRFSWRRVLVKEYGTPFGWIAGLCALGLLRVAGTESLEAEHPLLTEVLLAVLVVAALLWGVARWLKKSRIVVAD